MGAPWRGGSAIRAAGSDAPPDNDSNKADPQVNIVTPTVASQPSRSIPKLTPGVLLLCLDRSRLCDLLPSYPICCIVFGDLFQLSVQKGPCQPLTASPLSVKSPTGWQHASQSLLNACMPACNICVSRRPPVCCAAMRQACMPHACKNLHLGMIMSYHAFPTSFRAFHRLLPSSTAQPWKMQSPPV